MQKMNGMEIMNKVRFVLPVVMVAMLVFFVASVAYFFATEPAIEEGKIYKIGYTYKATLPGNFAEARVEARVFDFADRNIPEKSVIAPLTDKNGLQLVVVNSRLPEATARLTRVKVPGIVVEGIEYSSGYNYLRWDYNPGRTEIQTVVPTLKPRQK